MQVELVERAMRGDQDAFASLAASTRRPLLRLAYRILRDPHRAQDATQQALLGAWRDLPTLRDPARFDAWLHRLVVNACYTEARGERRWVARVRVTHLRSSRLEPDVARSVVNRDELEGAFRRLSPEQRAVVVLHHHLGYPLTEIAATLGIPVGTARSRLHYAVRQLRAALDADGRASRRPRSDRHEPRDDRLDPGFDPRIADWLEHDPDQAPSNVLVGVLAALPAVAQGRARIVSSSTRTTPLAWMGVAAVAIVSVIGGLLAFGDATSSSFVVPGRAVPVQLTLASTWTRGGGVALTIRRDSLDDDPCTGGLRRTTGSSRRAGRRPTCGR